MFFNRRLRQIQKELNEMAKTLKDVIQEIRQSKSVQDGLIVERRELRAKLEAALEKISELENAAGGPEEDINAAIELLDLMEAEGNAALAENTDGTFEPSGN